MGGVDRSDQMLISYSTERKRVKKRYEKYCFHLINTCVVNSHIIALKISYKKSQLKFREQLIESLFLENKPVKQSRKHGRPSSSNIVRLTERHFPSFIGPNDIKENFSRRCNACSKNGIRKESRYECKECNVGLCAAPCFGYYHTKRDFSKVFE